MSQSTSTGTPSLAKGTLTNEEYAANTPPFCYFDNPMHAMVTNAMSDSADDNTRLRVLTKGYGGALDPLLYDECTFDSVRWLTQWEQEWDMFHKAIATNRFQGVNWGMGPATAAAAAAVATETAPDDAGGDADDEKEVDEVEGEDQGLVGVEDEAKEEEKREKMVEEVEEEEGEKRDDDDTPPPPCSTCDRPHTIGECDNPSAENGEGEEEEEEEIVGEKSEKGGETEEETLPSDVDSQI